MHDLSDIAVIITIATSAVGLATLGFRIIQRLIGRKRKRVTLEKGKGFVFAKGALTTLLAVADLRVVWRKKIACLWAAGGIRALVGRSIGATEIPSRVLSEWQPLAIGMTYEAIGRDGIGRIFKVFDVQDDGRVIIEVAA